jgi:hypothetical protein
VYAYVHSFVYGLFNDAVSTSDYVYRQVTGRVMNNEVVRIWRETAVA